MSAHRSGVSSLRDRNSAGRLAWGAGVRAARLGACRLEEAGESPPEAWPAFAGEDFHNEHGGRRGRGLREIECNELVGKRSPSRWPRRGSILHLER